MAGAKHFSELISWQLADQLRVEVFKFTSRPGFVRDLKLHSQTEDAVNSICRNISEGFGCGHAEFARFLRISRRSMNELQDAFRAAELKRYVTADDLTASRQLMRRLASPATSCTPRTHCTYRTLIHFPGCGGGVGGKIGVAGGICPGCCCGCCGGGGCGWPG